MIFKKITGETPIFDGKNHWFPVKIFPSTNPLMLASPGMARLWEATWPTAVTMQPQQVGMLP
jgi:hypothetical protein